MKIERANAKINLYLDVISRRDDGFHDIKTVMHSLDLHDYIAVKSSPAKETSISIFVKGGKYLPADKRNIAYKAAELFLSKLAVSARVEITLEKRIPVAAGLAGGSSDAAAVLRAMNKLFGKPFSYKLLHKFAAELGSDVPYCLYGKTALCEGRGELMTKLPDNLKLHCVIAIANEKMSTPIAYSALDELYHNFDGSVKQHGDGHYNILCNSFESGELYIDGLYNIFEDAVLPLCPGAAEIKKKLISLGASAAMMSGSGPSVFGVYSNREDAENACRALRNDGVRAFVAKSV